MEQCLLEGFWPSPSTLATSRHLLEGRTPPSWRQAFPTAGLALQGWVDRLAAIIDYIPQLLQAKELQVIPAPGSFPQLLAPSLPQVLHLGRLVQPPRLLLALLLESGGHPDKTSLRLEQVDGSKELEHLHTGCYLDTIHLYGGRVSNCFFSCCCSVSRSYCHSSSHTCSRICSRMYTFTRTRICISTRARSCSCSRS